MSNAVTHHDLGPGARFLFERRLKKELSSDSHVHAAYTIKLIALKKGGDVSPTAQIVVDALDATRTSAATTAFFAFLVSITLGIYLLWALCFVRCISSDPNSFFRQAVVAMDKLCEERPEPVGGDGTSDASATTVSAILAAKPLKEDAETVDEDLSSLNFPANNPLEVACGYSFQAGDGFCAYINNGFANEAVCSAYELCRSLLAVIDSSAAPAPYIAVLVSVIRDHRQWIIHDWSSVSFFRSYGMRCCGGNWPTFLQNKPNAEIGDGGLNAFYDAMERIVTTVEKRNTYRSLLHSKRNSIRNALGENMGRPFFKEMCAERLAGEVWEEFQSKLAAAVGEPPLNEFFTMAPTESRKAVSLCSIQSKIVEGLEKIKYATDSFSFESLHLHDCSDILSLVPLQAITAEGGAKTAYDDASLDDQSEADEKIRKLFNELGSAVKSKLASTAFEFALSDGSDGLPERIALMTFPQFFHAKAREWERMRGDGGISNGDAFANAKREYEDSMAQFNCWMKNLPPPMFS